MKSFNLKPLHAALLTSGLVLAVPLMQTTAATNPCAANPCAANPCAAKNPCAANPCAANPCAVKNPCAAANACNPCAAKNPCNPCAAANPCAAKNPCNPCSAAANPCAAKNPCNPCAAKNPCNPCAANPCSAGNIDPTLITRPAGTSLKKGDYAALAAQGKVLWADVKLSTNGLACATCHTGNAAFGPSFALPYPHKVAMVTGQSGVAELSMDEMVQFCMVSPMAAKPLPWDSTELAALTAYALEIQVAMQANPCAAKNPCAANPCAAKNPCNPCAAKNACSPCNPCAAKNPCAANPCAAKNPCAAS